MMSVIRDETVWICVDCLVLAANDDTSSLCICEGERHSDHAPECPAGILRAAFGESLERWYSDVSARWVHVVPAECEHDYDEDPDQDCVRDTFSRGWCPTCGSTLAGERYLVHVIVVVPS